MPDLLNDPAFVKEQYNDVSNLDARIALHERFSTATRKLPVRIFDHFDLPPAARVLELGCGTGARIMNASQRLGN